MGGGRSTGRNMAMGGLGALAASVLARRAGGSMGRALTGGLGGMGGGNMRGAVGAGGLAVLAMVAMNALRNSGQQQSQASQPQALLDEAPDQAVSEDTALLVLRAMIAAAKADGQIDARERQRITAKLEETGGADQESLDFLQSEMDAPLDVASIAAQARDPVVAAQVYAASLLAIEVDTPAERAYLRDLAQHLQLQPQAVLQLHQALGAPPPA
jgi:uncharacterized membrane protein YebE (DUF533 family)